LIYRQSAAIQFCWSGDHDQQPRCNSWQSCCCCCVSCSVELWYLYQIGVASLPVYLYVIDPVKGEYLPTRRPFMILARSFATVLCSYSVMVSWNSTIIKCRLREETTSFNQWPTGTVVIIFLYGLHNSKNLQPRGYALNVKHRCTSSHALQRVDAAPNICECKCRQHRASTKR
jgi:hypothetical protein